MFAFSLQTEGQKWKKKGQLTVCTKYFNYTHSWHSLYNCRLFAWHCTVVACLLYLWYRVVWHLLFGWIGKWTGLSEVCCELSDKYCPCILLNLFMYTDCQKIISVQVVNHDQEVRLFTARHLVIPTRQHSENWCLNDIIILRYINLKMEAVCSSVMTESSTLCIVRTRNTTTVWTVH